MAVSLQRFDIHLSEIFATHHMMRRRLPADEKGFGSAPVTEWGDAPKSGMRDAPKTGMGSKPKTGLGGKPKQKVTKKPKQGIGKRPKQGTGEKPRGFCKDCPSKSRHNLSRVMHFMLILAHTRLNQFPTVPPSRTTRSPIQPPRTPARHRPTEPWPPTVGKEALSLSPLLVTMSKSWHLTDDHGPNECHLML